MLFSTLMGQEETNLECNFITGRELYQLFMWKQALSVQPGIVVKCVVFKKCNLHTWLRKTLKQPGLVYVQNDPKYPTETFKQLLYSFLFIQNTYTHK